MTAYTSVPVGWKIYFWVMALLTVVPPFSTDPLTWATTPVSVLGLVGLFLYAWSRQGPGSARFWTVSAWVFVAVGVFGLGVGWFRSGPDIAPAIKIGGSLIAILLIGPNAVALFRLARRLEAQTPPR